MPIVVEWVACRLQVDLLLSRGWLKKRGRPVSMMNLLVCRLSPEILQRLDKKPERVTFVHSHYYGDRSF